MMGDQEDNPEPKSGSRKVDVSGKSGVGIGGDVTGTTIIAGDVHYHPVAEPSRVDQEDEAPAEGDPPYKGLQYFDVDDADLFFGREMLTAELVGRLRETNFLAVVGASGSGKSSVVRAGVVAALQKGEELADGTVPPDGCQRWQVHIITPTAKPLETLALKLTPSSESVTAAKQLREAMRSDSESLHLQVRRLIPADTNNRLLLIVDQFEELFTACKDPDERKAFVDNLLTAVDEETAGPTIVVITLRADFYHHCAQFDSLRQALENHQAFIGPMSEDELRQAIELPAKKKDWEFESGLVELMLRDVGEEPGALPLLSHALLETWEKRSGRTMTLPGYSSAGGVHGAIAKTADRVYDGLDEEQKSIARNIFLRLTELGEGAQDTRRRASLSELISGSAQADELKQVLTTLTDRRLVTTDQETAAVAHEALIREWPLLRNWLEEDREGLRLHRQLIQAAVLWEEQGRDDAWLYGGGRLIQALEWAETSDLELNELEEDFLNASRESSERQEAEQEAARQRELEQAQRLAATRRQRGVFLTAGMIVAVIMGIVAFSLFVQSNRSLAVANEANATSTANLATANVANTQSAENASAAEDRRIQAEAAEAIAVERGDALATAQVQTDLQRQQVELQAQIARFEELSAQSLVQKDSSEDLAMLLSAEAFRQYDSFRLRQALYTIWQHNPQLLQIFQGHESTIRRLAFSPDGTILASVSDDRSIRLWDVQIGSPTFGHTLGEPLLGHEDGVLSVAFSPDGVILASGSDDATIRLWDVEVGSPTFGQLRVEPLLGHNEDVRCLALSPDGTVLASGSSDLTIRLWDVDEGSPTFGQPLGEPLVGHDDSVRSVSFSPDGSRLASGSGDETIRLWDLDASSPTFGQPLGEPLVGQEGGVWSVSFSPDGAILASGSSDRTIRLWDVDEGSPTFGQPLGEPLVGHEESVYSVWFSPDGARLASGSRDATIRLWDVKVGSPAFGQPLGAPLRGHGGRVWSAAFGPDGATLASGSSDSTIRLWDVDEGSPTFGQSLEESLLWHDDGVSSVSISPDGASLASGSSNGTIYLWGMEEGSPTVGQPVVVMMGHGDSVESLVFTQEGQVLASGGCGEIDDDGFCTWGEVWLWDVDASSPTFGQPLAEPLEGHDDGVLSVAFSPDGAILASGSLDDTIRLWDTSELLTTGSVQPLGEPLRGHESGFSSVAFSPDGQVLASGSGDATIRLWDADASSPTFGQPLGEPLVAHEDWVLSVAFSPDGSILASGSSDDTIRLWDADASSTTFGQPLAEPLEGHDDGVLSVAFSPDGSILASGSGDDTIQLWNVADAGSPTFGQPLGEPLIAHEDGVNWVTFSSDGAVMASGSGDGTIRLWAANPEAWTEYSCQRAGRNLTEAEWNRFLPWKEYDPEYRTCPQWTPGG